MSESYKISGQYFINGYEIWYSCYRKIVKMIGDHKATKKLERIMRFFNKNPTDYPGLEVC